VVTTPPGDDEDVGRQVLHVGRIDPSTEEAADGPDVLREECVEPGVPTLRHQVSSAFGSGLLFTRSVSRFVPSLQPCGDQFARCYPQMWMTLWMNHRPVLPYDCADHAGQRRRRP